MKTYEQVVEYLYTRLPMFQRIGPPAFKKDLSRTIRLCQVLDNPQTKFKCLHIAGTNGKGSVSHILASLLIKAGYKTGLLTSPHLLDFRERIKINGKEIPENFVVEFVHQWNKEIEEIDPSFFELTVAMAFDYFAEERVQYAVIETGLGGRLDSTNIITPEIAVITHISFDHTNLLGHTMEQIAYEKAGIIKPGVPVVIGRKQKDIQHVFESVAREKNAPIIYASDICETVQKSRNFSTALYESTVFESNKKYAWESDLVADYQAENINTAFCTAMQLPVFNASMESYFRQALRQVCLITGLRGRWEVVSEKPLIIADIGHNPEALSQTLKQLENYDFENLYILYGSSEDKDLDGIMKLLPTRASYVFSRPNVPRGMNANELAKKAAQSGLNGRVIEQPDKALKYLLNNIKQDDLLLITGSAFLVADALAYLEQYPKSQ